MDLVYKVLDCEVKKLDDSTYEFTASTSDIDRDGEVIDVKGWDLKNFKKNPVIMYGHDYKSLPIGRAPRVWVSKEGNLKNTVQFPPEGTYEFADVAHRLVDAGYLKTESVGFMPKEWEDGDGVKAPYRTYKKQELLEISIVPVPSNPFALANALEAGVITTKEFKAITDLEKKPGLSYTTTVEEPLPEERPLPKDISQNGIMDELDYIATLIEGGDLSQETKKAALKLSEIIKRVCGNDIPLEIEDKITHQEIAHVPKVQGVEPPLTEALITYQEILGAIKRIAIKRR